MHIEKNNNVAKKCAEDNKKNPTNMVESLKSALFSVKRKPITCEMSQ